MINLEQLRPSDKQALVDMQRMCLGGDAWVLGRAVSTFVDVAFGSHEAIADQRARRDTCSSVLTPRASAGPGAGVGASTSTGAGAAFSIASPLAHTHVGLHGSPQMAGYVVYKHVDMVRRRDPDLARMLESIASLVDGESEVMYVHRSRARAAHGMELCHTPRNLPGYVARWQVCCKPGRHALSPTMRSRVRVGGACNATRTLARALCGGGTTCPSEQQGSVESVPGPGILLG